MNVQAADDDTNCQPVPASAIPPQTPRFDRIVEGVVLSRVPAPAATANAEDDEIPTPTPAYDHPVPPWFSPVMQALLALCAGFVIAYTLLRAVSS